MPDAEAFSRAADEALEGAYEPPMSLTEYVEAAFRNPSIAAGAAGYLLEAIEASGTRTVRERGEKLTRYRFFDDPYGDGEHAVLGNTGILNAFVDDLRAIVTGRGKEEKIIWFDGPTATGKSELKRCLVNGLRGYSRTAEGRRYTLEWNVAGGADERSLGYGDGYVDEDDWYASPVQVHPLSAFPREVREELVAALSAETDRELSVPGELDPFSREAYDFLEERYRRAGRSDRFSAVTDRSHCRVKNYVVDVGQGIGILHSEDDGTAKERLVGSWMPGMLRELDSRGRKNPQAFSYDGVLSQGNGLLTVVEDASQHADLLRKLLNVPDEGRVKLDKGIGMDVDTQLVVISNPDLGVELDQYADRDGSDPLKALKRRLDRQEFRYLTNRRLEAELVHRELTGETEVWATAEGVDPDERVREAVHVPIRDGSGRSRELAPHAIAAAATYDVVSRLDAENVPGDLDLVEKAILFERGYVQEGDERREIGEFEFDVQDAHDGQSGIPVTYTRDVIAELLEGEGDRSHPELRVEDVIMPDDVLDAMATGVATAPVFSRAEAAEFENRVATVKSHVRDRQEADVLDAILSDVGVDEETVAEYVEHVYAWDTDGTVDTPRGKAEPDPLVMKLFETEHLGRFDDGDYDDGAPTEPVAAFRRKKVIAALNRYAWEHRDEDFAVEGVDLREVPVIRTVLEADSWDDVRRLFPDFDPDKWDDPPADTETETVKEQTIDRLCDRGYSPASAELTSRLVLREVAHEWD
ncbi:MAG: kinase anchor protein [Haloferacaceae archaeon]